MMTRLMTRGRRGVLANAMMTSSQELALTRALRARPPEVPEKAPLKRHLFISCFAAARAAYSNQSPSRAPRAAI